MTKGKQTKVKEEKRRRRQRRQHRYRRRQRRRKCCLVSKSPFCRSLSLICFHLPTHMASLPIKTWKVPKNKVRRDRKLAWRN